jgi:hypothetical protein
MLTNAGQPVLVTRTQDALVLFAPPLKFRTAGFSQYGFKREIRAATFAPRGQLIRRPLPPMAPKGHACCLTGQFSEALSSTSPWLARGSAVPPAPHLLWVDPSPSPPPADLWIRRRVFPFLPVRAGHERVPNLLCLSLSCVPSSVPPVNRTIALGCFFIARFGLPDLRNGSAPASLRALVPAWSV